MKSGQKLPVMAAAAEATAIPRSARLVSASMPAVGLVVLMDRRAAGISTIIAPAVAAEVVGRGGWVDT